MVSAITTPSSLSTRFTYYVKKIVKFVFLEFSETEVMWNKHYPVQKIKHFTTYPANVNYFFLTWCEGSFVRFSDQNFLRFRRCFYIVVNFSYFRLLLENHCANFIQICTKHPCVKGINFFSKEGPHPFLKGRFHQNSENT